MLTMFPAMSCKGSVGMSLVVGVDVRFRVRNFFGSLQKLEIAKPGNALQRTIA